MSVSVALQQIVESELGPKLKVNATTLLNIAHSDNGYVCISWEELGDLFCAAPATVQRQLGDLHKARIIHYSSNGDGLVYVIFKAWTPAERMEDDENHRKNRRKVSKKSTESVEKIDGIQNDGAEDTRIDRQKDAKTSTESVEKIDDSYTHASARSVSQLVSSLPTDNDQKLTNLQTPPQQEQARSHALLTDAEVGIDPRLAREFATDFSFDYLLRHVCVWRDELSRGKARGAGALVTRIKRNYGGMITEADRSTPLYRRHVPLEETAADDEEQRRRKYDPAFWQE